MKLFEMALTPNCKRVNIFLNELGVELEHVHVDVRGGENLTADFAQKSLNGKVPTLQLDEHTFICESMAICRYFDETTPSESSLFGDSPLERARVEMWNRIIEWDGLLPAFQAFRNISGVYQDRENCIPAWGEESKLRVEKFLPKLAQQLTASTFIVGDKLTVADISAWILVLFCESRLELPVQQQYPTIAAWYQLLASRPAFA
ncbi:glutathione S-transferase family protein [Shewanella avicenniae]|uniref:Glutathione S-transferase family protein n=1 Tax=Shewanella avicenniae TaxID=2814294 RepID=A0ABX7QRZ1_9GAMM|nr:glutathione S-transferase family protein [Shewanella avicenniae]QSX34218.1 glutathione S-transferase family protein [Shewanella avicenniae]